MTAPVAQPPLFVVVGQPNEGKTTVIATLAEDDSAEISNVPGTTRALRRYQVSVDGETIFILCDTPGFERPSPLLQWLRANEGLDNPAASALATFAADPKMTAECEILKPLAQGAVALYVVDASRKPREVDGFEIEILRLCRNKRVGLINSKDVRGEWYGEWRKLMERDFNHLREFNAHEAAFPDRIGLLQAVQVVAGDAGLQMAGAIRALELDWDSRLRFAADQIIRTQKQLYGIRHKELYDYRVHDKESIKAKCKAAVEKEVRSLEGEFRKAIRRAFKHAKDRWQTEDLLVRDIFHEDVWRCLGLPKSALIAVGAAMGAIAGGMVDLVLIGHGLGLPTAAGAVGGAALTWFAADKVVDVDFPTPQFPFTGGRRKLGGAHVQSRVEPRSNLGYILLDRMLLYVRHAANWSHGRRTARPVSLPTADGGDGKQGSVAHFSEHDQTKILAPFIAAMAKENLGGEKFERIESAWRELLVSKLRELTGAGTLPAPGFDIRGKRRQDQ